jgi:hypothetical protein
MFEGPTGGEVILGSRKFSILLILLVLARGSAYGATSLSDKICHEDEGVLTHLLHGISGWLAKRAERQSLVSCLESLCPDPVGVRDSPDIPKAMHEFNHIADPDYADEVGLTVSQQSRLMRDQVSKCLKSQLGTDLDRSGYRSREDFADLNLPTKSVHRITYCPVVKGANGYFAKESGFDEAHHSPPVFILLHEAFRASGNLTKDCQAYVSKYKPWKFRDCLAGTDAEKP